MDEKDIQLYSYNITLDTPAGTRYGYLEMKVDQGIISGCCDILNHKSTICGQVLKHGECMVTGTLTSLMQEVTYKAFGRFDTQTIELILTGSKNNYRLTGIATRRN